MTDFLTPAVQRALETARRLAGEAEVGRLHVLQALLAEDEGRPAMLLRQRGVALAALQRDLLASTAGSSGVYDLLRSARVLAREIAGEMTVATEHCLLAILQEDAELRALATAHGLDFEELLASLKPPPIQLDEPLRLVETTERMDLARILDANANRAREAIRVLEDHCRFALNDAFLSGQWKQMRHDLAAALATVPDALLMAGRDTQHDVGTQLSTARETERTSLANVVAANAKRLQEALRALEEYGKVHAADLGRAIETLRYRSYTLERAMLAGSTARARLMNAQLCVLVTGAVCQASLEWTIKEAVAGGAQVIQLREKQLSDRALLERAANACRWTRQAGAIFIVNDRPDVARLVDADGVHVGQDDLPVAAVRRIVGPDLLVGVSTHDLGQLRQAILDGASYAGIGPTFASGTKSFSDLAGLAYVREATTLSSIPTFAIGGIDERNVDQVVAAGARRIAVSQAICTADEPREVATRLRAALPAL